MVVKGRVCSELVKVLMLSLNPEKKRDFVVCQPIFASKKI